jgi:hypothetical protein
MAVIVVTRLRLRDMRSFVDTEPHLSTEGSSIVSATKPPSSTGNNPAASCQIGRRAGVGWLPTDSRRT